MRTWLALLLTFTPIEASAEMSTAQMTLADLQQICSGASSDDANACRFFILGVLDGASMATGAKTPLGPLCIAPGVPGSALVAVVKKTMGEDLASNPEDKSLAAAGAVVAIVMNAFPCQNPE